MAVVVEERQLRAMQELVGMAASRAVVVVVVEHLSIALAIAEPEALAGPERQSSRPIFIR